MMDNPDVVDSTAEANYRVTAGELRQFIERVERLEVEKKDLAEQIKDCASATRTTSPKKRRCLRCTKKRLAWTEAFCGATRPAEFGTPSKGTSGAFFFVGLVGR